MYKTKSRGDPNMTRIRILLDQENSYSLIKAYIKDSQCFFFRFFSPITLKIYLNFNISVSHISK